MEPGVDDTFELTEVFDYSHFLGFDADEAA
jgi:hypothetical protein